MGKLIKKPAVTEKAEKQKREPKRQAALRYLAQRLREAERLTRAERAQADAEWELVKRTIQQNPVIIGTGRHVAR